MLPATHFPVTVGQAGDFFVGRHWRGNGRNLREVAAYAVHLGSGAGVSHGYSDINSYNRSPQHRGAQASGFSGQGCLG